VLQYGAAIHAGPSAQPAPATTGASAAARQPVRRRQPARLPAGLRIRGLRLPWRRFLFDAPGRRSVARMASPGKTTLASPYQVILYHHVAVHIRRFPRAGVLALRSPKDSLRQTGVSRVREALVSTRIGSRDGPGGRHRRRGRTFGGSNRLTARSDGTPPARSDCLVVYCSPVGCLASTDRPKAWNDDARGTGVAGWLRARSPVCEPVAGYRSATGRRPGVAFRRFDEPFSLKMRRALAMSLTLMTAATPPWPLPGICSEQ